MLGLAKVITLEMCSQHPSPTLGSSRVQSSCRVYLETQLFFEKKEEGP